MYPHPVMRLPIVSEGASNCRVPTPARSAALRWTGSRGAGPVECGFRCMKCVEACPFGMTILRPRRLGLSAEVKPVRRPAAMRRKMPQRCPCFIPKKSLGESKRLNNILSYTHMKEIDFTEKGEQRTDPLRRDRQGGSATTVKSGYFKKSLPRGPYRRPPRRAGRPLSNQPSLRVTSADCGFAVPKFGLGPLLWRTISRSIRWGRRTCG